MTRERAEIDSWVAGWPVGSKGIFGARVKEKVTVIGVDRSRGWPTLELLATTGHVYYCKYGTRQYLAKLSIVE